MALQNQTTYTQDVMREGYKTYFWAKNKSLFYVGLVLCPLLLVLLALGVASSLRAGRGFMFSAFFDLLFLVMVVSVTLVLPKTGYKSTADKAYDQKLQTGVPLESFYTFTAQAVQIQDAQFSGFYYWHQCTDVYATPNLCILEFGPTFVIVDMRRFTAGDPGQFWALLQQVGKQVK